MKLQFPRLVNPLGSNTYGLNGDVLEKAIRTALIPLSLPSDKARNEAIQAVFSAFQDGMRKGYSGEPSDSGKAECREYMATAEPYTSEFNLYKKLI